jgi:hypothetical protein
MDGPKPSSEVFKAAIDAGYSRDQVKDAKRRIGAVAHRHGFQEGAQWTWQLPTAKCSHRIGKEVCQAFQPEVARKSAWNA